MSDLFGELRVAFRQWRRRPLVPLTIIVTLTAGMGAATAVFAVTLGGSVAADRGTCPGTTGVDRSAIAQHHRPVIAWCIFRMAIHVEDLCGPGCYQASQRRACGFDTAPIECAARWSLNPCHRSSRIRPVAGRVFTAQEAQPGAPRTILISHRLWTNRYAADLSVVGARRHDEWRPGNHRRRAAGKRRRPRAGSRMVVAACARCQGPRQHGPPLSRRRRPALDRNEHRSGARGARRVERTAAAA